MAGLILALLLAAPLDKLGTPRRGFPWRTAHSTTAYSLRPTASRLQPRVADRMLESYSSRMTGETLVGPREPHAELRQSEKSDRSLLRRFENGEEDAATALYLRYAKRLSLLTRSQAGSELAVRLDPEDVVQSVFRTFFRRAAEGHYEIPDGEELWKLFLVIALNKVRALGQRHRAAKRDVERTTHLGTVEPFIASGPVQDEAAYRVLRLTIDELLAELSEIEVQIVTMRIDGFNVQQIADATRRSKRTVERVLQGFRRRLAAVLKEE